MSLLTLLERYRIALERAVSPRSKNFARLTAYVFPKYCRWCRAGMKAPAKHDRKKAKALFNSGFCSETCLNTGERPDSCFQRSLKSQASVRLETHHLDDLLEISRQIKATMTKRGMSEVERLVHEVDEKYSMLSEKLSAMEMLTDRQWGASKFYFYLRKAG